jgi:trehalose 6-phosphate phosphatase
MTIQTSKLPQTPSPASPAPPAVRSDWALFLDFDGTLVELGDDPAHARIDARMSSAVTAAREYLGGALALVSGRPLGQIDQRFTPHTMAVAGIHGLERRSAQGVLFGATPSPALRDAARKLRAAFAGEPRILIEDKGAALAVHYRLLREAAPTVLQVVEAVARELGPGYRMLRGSDVLELLPTTVNKGTAVREFMAEAPFAGRVPVFVGDDITDLDGFEAARQLGGAGIAVGARVVANYSLPDVATVCAWLQAGRP